MKTVGYIVLTGSLLLLAAGCSKTDSTDSKQTSTEPQVTQAVPPVSLPAEKPKVVELTKESLVEAFKRASVDNLPVFLKIADVQFEVVSSVDTTRVIKGTVTLEVLEDTFTESRVLKYQTPSTAYSVQLLKTVKKKGDQIYIPFSERINLAAPQLRMQMPALEDFGREAAKFPHSYVEGGEQAVKAEGLIQAALDAARKANLVKDKWECLGAIQKSLTDVSAFADLVQSVWRGKYLNRAFDDREFQTKWNEQIYPDRKFNSKKDQFAAHCKLVQSRFDEEYPAIQKIVSDAKDKAKACSDYLLNL
jgi:hypothetical protein